MGKGTDSLYHMIEEGDKGVEKFNTGLEKLQMFTDPVRKGVMTVIGASPGAGKTTLVLFNYVYKPILNCIELGKKNLKIIIFCLELKKEDVLAKILSMIMYDKFGIEIGYREMLSFSGPLARDIFEKLNICREILAKIESFIIFVEGKLTASTFSDFMIKYYMRRGIFTDEGNNAYQPNDESLITLAVIDHIGETAVEPRETEKQAQDNLAEELKKYRNICGLSSIVVQQINRGASSVDRRTKFPGLELNDLKGTGNAAEKADNVIGLYYPFREKLSKWGPYDVLRMKQVLRGIQVLKNRYGTADVNIGLAFYGHPSVMKELPYGDNAMLDYSAYDTASYYKDFAGDKFKDIDNI